MTLHIFGIRHHGPGCARSLLAALEALQPDILLVEGPPDAADALPLIAHEGLKPPVALLVYAQDEPRRAAFYPFATYSPEWQALRYAVARGVPARFMDLPQSIRIAMAIEEEAVLRAQLEAAQGDGADVPPHTGSPVASVATEAPQREAVKAEAVTWHDDPIGKLAEAAGYTDHELWWEHQIEQRQDATDLFAGIMEAMVALRAAAPPTDPDEARREAHMRQAIRAAQKEGFERIAVVCGAWHAPVLAELGNAKADAALLAGLKRAKVAATWIPWTNSRLSYRSGYGAGVYSPGWYEHLWTAPDRHAIRWVARAAHLLRGDDLDAPSSGVIEAVRLAETLAALRDLPLPGLAELHEAIQTVLCKGDDAPMQLIRDRLEIGDRLGEVPAETPAVPLQRDLEARQRRLRLRPSPEIKSLDLDLRDDIGRERSQLLHALRLLGIEWGKRERTGGGKGTFHELWQLAWRPELAVAVIEASVWGNTVEAAATAKLRHDGDATGDLPVLTRLLDDAILAALLGAVAHLLGRVRDASAVAADARHLMDALPPLARVARYGDVRGTDQTQVLPIIEGLVARIVIGLPGACSSLDDAAATEMVSSIDRAQESLALLDIANLRADWRGTLGKLVERETIHGLVRGRATRLLLEEGAIDGDEVQRLARLALSPATPTPDAAAWIAGVVRGSALLLLQQSGLWSALDAWLRDLSPDAFTEALPLVRRAFAGFQPPERRAMGDKVKHLGRDGSRTTPAGDDELMAGIDRARADLVLPVLAQILGVAS
jgi:hypothetical protein